MSSFGSLLPKLSLDWSPVTRSVKLSKTQSDDGVAEAGDIKKESVEVDDIKTELGVQKVKYFMIKVLNIQTRRTSERIYRVKVLKNGKVDFSRTDGFVRQVINFLNFFGYRNKLSSDLNDAYNKHWM